MVEGGGRGCRGDMNGARPAGVREWGWGCGGGGAGSTGGTLDGASKCETESGGGCWCWAIYAMPAEQPRVRQPNGWAERPSSFSARNSPNSYFVPF